MEKTGLVFDIQHYCIHDGPGIRTNVFLKGCPLRCRWCANPESNTVLPQLMYRSETCTGCAACIPACAESAIRKSSDGTVSTDRSKCNGCGRCVPACLAGARSIAGRVQTVAEVYREVAMDRLFYGTDGGVTVTGGEVLMQAGFVAALLRMCREHGIGTCIETSGFGTWEQLCEVAEYTDLVLYDVKHMDTERHCWGTGQGNERILSNLERLSREMNMPVIVRMPLIPDYNDTEENLRAMAEFLKEKVPTLVEVHLLPYHNLGEGKRGQLGDERRFQGMVPEGERMERCLAVLRQCGLRGV